MFEPDEYIFSKFAKFLKRRKKSAEEAIEHTVKLTDLKPRLTIFARAITGKPIEIFEAEREGGYKNDNIFLPARFSEFTDTEQNLSFYLFRILYLSVQKNIGLNFYTGDEYTLEEAREKALGTSEEVLAEVFGQFPIAKNIHSELVSHFREKFTKKKPIDYSFIYEK